jgi:hypothetical protein
MKGALDTLRELSSAFSKSGETFGMRVLTDLTGPYYTLVLESTFNDLAAYEGMMQSETASPHWQTWYKSFVPFLVDGHREIFTIALEE